MAQLQAIFLLFLVNFTFISSVDIISGYKYYTNLEVGNVNILLSAPHNGELKPSDIADRVLDQGSPSKFLATSILESLPNF